MPMHLHGGDVFFESRCGGWQGTVQFVCRHAHICSRAITRWMGCSCIHQRSRFIFASLSLKPILYFHTVQNPLSPGTMIFDLW